SEEMSLMQLVERDEMDEDDDLFEAIDKCPSCSSSSEHRFYIIANSLWSSINLHRFHIVFGTIAQVIAQGINSGDVKKLQDDRIHTCNGLMMHTKKVKTDTPMQVYYSKKKQGKRVLEAEEGPSQGDEEGTSNG
ncbi:hypothetical protein DY000_02049121, partial [Brassica cretica]